MSVLYVVTFELVALFICNIHAQYGWQPNWGSISCDETVTGRFLEGSEYFGVTRYYTLTTSYATELYRDVYISTCVLDQGFNQHDRELDVYLAYEDNWDTCLYYPWSPDWCAATVNDWDSCDDGYVGFIYKFEDLPPGTYFFGIWAPNDVDSDGYNHGGEYSISVECYNPPTPAPSAPFNYTMEFPYYDEWEDTGSKDISCGLDVMGSLEPYEDVWYQYEIVEYATEMTLTACSSAIGIDLISYYYWNYNTSAPHEWLTDDGNGCGTITLTDEWRVSPGIYYLSLNNTYSWTSGNYILSMRCWDDSSVKTATNYQIWTPSPTAPTVTTTAFPTSANPTNANTTYSPTAGPTAAFNYDSIKEKKVNYMGDISCGVYRHDKLKKREVNWYKFEVNTELSWFTFDTCMNDVTKFFNRFIIFEYDHSSWIDDWDALYTVSDADTYCNVLNTMNDLPVGQYAVMMEGYDRGSDNDDYGDYILRMTCSEWEYYYVDPVEATDEPTPAPTGQLPLPSRDDKIIGDIGCDVTLSGELKAGQGHFHEFTVKQGGVEWVTFDTCTDTDFENYLFCYNYYNYTSGEQWQYTRDNSIGFHYEDDSKCNELTMNDLSPGTYYVLIEGYNYYFDDGDYTITMSCSDNSAVASASNYTDYYAALEWWAILLIVIAVLIVILICVVIVCWCWRRKRSDSPPPAPNSAEMAKSGSGGTTGGEFEE